MSRLRTGGLGALAMLVVIGVGLAAGYASDRRAHRGEVLANVELAGRSIGGLDRAALRRVVDETAARAARTRITVRVGDVGFDMSPEEAGTRLDAEATVRDALAVGRKGTLPGKLVGWAAGLVRDREAPLRVTVDPDAVARTVAARDPGPRKEPVEPTIAFEDGRFVAVPGAPGRGIDPRDVVAAVRESDAGDGRVVVEVVPRRIRPHVTDVEAERLAVAAEPLGRNGVTVTLDGTAVDVPARTVRSWLHATRVGRRLQLAVDVAEASTDLRELAPRAGRPAVDATFRIGASGVELVPARAGERCCAPDMDPLLLTALQRNPDADPPVALPLESVAPERTDEEARALGIVGAVGTFTTRHRAGEARVANIHRIADLVRGQVIEPGKTFSVNRFVGRRTRDKGFVSAGVIENGVFTESVGGGISQFATTLFNAAFFAGLDFGEYQSHSIYISRYPYGREATLSYPHPDLEIENKTPYGVLIWPSYTSSSITVTLYSTKHVEAEQTGQRTAPRGNCTSVVTERTRRWLDTGKTEVDRVRATYRPGEGVNC